MVAKQRIRMANEKHSKNITQRGNVAKSTVSHLFYCSDFYYSLYSDICVCFVCITVSAYLVYSCKIALDSCFIHYIID